MRKLGVGILNSDRAELDLAELESLCTYPGWVLIDETILGNRPISEEQKLLRMDPLHHAPKHVPLMDLASFLMYCALRRFTEKPMPRGKWTLGDTYWKDPRQTLRVEWAPPATVIVSRESHHLKHGSRHAHA